MSALIYVDNLKDYKKHVSVAFNETKIKEGLFYNKNEGRIVRFVEFRGII